MNHQSNLNGHRALITGASGGIGEEFARQLAALGSDLILAARRIDRLENLAQELRRQYSIQIECIQIDLSQPNASQTLFEKATSHHKEITILINNAGIAKYGRFLDFTLPEQLSTLQINSTVPTEMTYLFCKHMLKHGKPSYIAQIASIASFNPVSFFSVYCASKAYLLYFSEILSFELKGTNIRTTCICPGGTYTGFFEHSGQKVTSRGHLTMMTSEKVVRGSIQAMLSEKSVYIPGILNKLACFLPRLLPRKFALYMATKTMSQAVEQVPQKPQ